MAGFDFLAGLKYGTPIQASQQYLLNQQNFQRQGLALEQARAQQARDIQTRQALGSTLGAMFPSAPPAPQAPPPGQASVPMGPPTAPVASGAATSPPVPPYQTVQGLGKRNQMLTGNIPGQSGIGFAGDPKAMADEIIRSNIPPADKQAAMEQLNRQIAGMSPPPVASQGESDIGTKSPTVAGMVAALRAQGIPQDQWLDVLNGMKPVFDDTNRQLLMQMKAQKDAVDAAYKISQAETNALRARYYGENVESMGAKRRADETTATTGIDPSTVDYYAAQSLAGDNSWQVGLARGKVGQKLIAAVKDRIPQMAAEKGITPQGAMANKADLAAKTAALKDREKFVAAGNQYITNFNTQADLVEKYLKPGAAGSVPAINKWIQAGRASLAGDPDVSAFDTAIRGLAREHQRIVTGVTSNAQLHVAAQQTADELLNRAQTPEQIRSVLKVMREEAKNALSAGKSEVSRIKEDISGAPTPGAGGGKTVNWSDLK